MRTRLLGLFATLVLATSACSDSGSPETTAPMVDAPETTAVSAPTRAVEPDDSTTVAVSVATVASEPSTSVVADPPITDCPVVVPDGASVELLITDNGVLYAGNPAPPCLSVPASQFLSLVNNAEGDATITVGGATEEVFAGVTFDSEPVAAYAAVGATFTVAVAELDTTITVHVLPAT